MSLTLTLTIVAMNLIKPSRALYLEVVLSIMNINELNFSISPNCQLTSLGSVSCPMGGLGYVTLMNLISGLLLKHWPLGLGLRGMGKGVECS